MSTARAASSEWSDVDHVVLGMIGLGARSGYDVKQMVQDSIRFFWTISQAQIYPSLRRLEAAKLIRSKPNPDNKRRPRTYELTPSGTAALQGWITREDPMPFELRDIAMVKLFFADAVAAAPARRLLAAVQARSQQRIETLHRIEPAAAALSTNAHKHYPQLTALLGIAYHQAIVDVCDQFRTDRPAP
jgi:DNA-binding PadR family transcriptional regulator